MQYSLGKGRLIQNTFVLKKKGLINRKKINQYLCSLFSHSIWFIFLHPNLPLFFFLSLMGFYAPYFNSCIHTAKSMGNRRWGFSHVVESSEFQVIIHISYFRNTRNNVQCRLQFTLIFSLIPKINLFSFISHIHHNSFHRNKMQ